MVRKRLNSFKYALSGLKTALKEEPNLKIHMTLGILTFCLGFYFQLTTTEWFIIILAIGLVIGVELTNTAIEEIVDAFTDVIHPSAKRAKDIAAAAVLVISISAAMIGAIVFIPYFIRLLF